MAGIPGMPSMGGGGSVGTLFVKITADTSGLAARLKAESEKAGQKYAEGFGGGLANGLDKAGSKISAAGASVAAVGGKLTKGLTLPIVAVGTAAVVAGASFEKSMNAVKAVTGETGDKFDALSTQAKDLGRTTSFTASQAADGMTYLAMAGFKADDILKSMPATLNLAAAGSMDLARAADISSNILTGFGLSADEMGRTIDVMAQTFTNSNTNLEQLGDAMKYVAPVASAVGHSIEETSAALGLLGNAGIQGSMAGTTLRGALARLIDPPKKAANAIADLGIEVMNSDGSLKSMVEIVQELEKSGASTADMMAIFGLRAGPGMAALVSQGSDALQKLTDKNLDSVGRSAQIAETMLEGTAGAWVKLKSAFEGAMIAIAETGIIETLANVMMEATTYVQKFAQWVDQLSPKTKKMALQFAAIAAAAGPVVWILGKVIGTIGGIVKGVGALVGAVSAAARGISAAMTLLAANPVILIIAGVIAAVIALVLAVKYAYENFEWFRDFVDAVWQGIQDAAAAVVDWYQTTVAPAIEAVLEAAGAFFQEFSRVVSDVWNAVYAAVEVVVNWFQEYVWPVIEWVINAIITYFKVYYAVVSYVWGVVQRAIEVVVNWFKETVWPIIEWVIDAIVAYFEWYVGVVKTVWGKVQQVIDTVVGWFKETAWPKIKVVIDFIVDAFNWYKGVVQTVWNAVLKVIKKVVNWIVANVWPKIEPIVDLLVDGWNFVWEKTEEAWNNIMDFLKGLVPTMLKIGGDIIEGIKEGIGNAWESLVGWFKDKVNDLPEAVKYILGIHSPSRVMMTLGGNVVEGFGIGLEKIGKVNDEFYKKMETAVSKSEKQIKEWVDATKKQLDEATKAWTDYRDSVFSAITGNVSYSGAWKETEAQAKAVEDAQKKLDEAREKASGPDATDSDRASVIDAEKELEKARSAVRTFEQNMAKMIEDSTFFGDMFAKASDAMVAQFGPDSFIWQKMRQEMMAMGPEQGAAMAQYIAENGLSPEMVEQLTGWNAWAGNIAKEQAEVNMGQGVKMAEDAMKGLNKKIKDERARLVNMGEKMGDGVVVGFKNKESDFKKAIDSYIAAAYKTLGIHSPSRVFQEIGEYTAQGFNDGYESMILDPAAEMDTSFRFYAPSMSMANDMFGGDTEVKVFIGDRELTDIVDVQIDRNGQANRDMVIAGRRF